MDENLVIFFIHLLFYISVAIQFIFLWGVYFRFLKSKQKRRKRVPHQAISVIVAAHNEADNLLWLLEGIFCQTHPDFEVIVVNDRSEDNTQDLLEEIAKKQRKLKVVQIDETPSGIQEKKYAIMQGIHAAQHELLVLTDADCRPTSNQWLAGIQSCYQKGVNIVLGFSPYQCERGLLNAFIRYETMMTALNYFSLAHAGQPYMGVGRNISYRKSLFLQENGFGEKKSVIGGDDDLLVNRLANGSNTVTSWEKETHVLSIPKKTWFSWFKQKKRHLSVGVHYKISDKFVLGALVFSQIFFWVTSFAIFLTFSFDLTILVLISTRIISHVYIFYQANHKLHQTFRLLTVPFMDILYAAYLLIIGMASTLSKSKTWS